MRRLRLPDFVERPEATEMVRRTITSGTGRHEVIVGNPGTGRSIIGVCRGHQC